MFKLISAVILLIIYTDFVSAQKIVSFKRIRGEYILDAHSEISLKAGYEKAVNEAKLEALRKAGISENVSASDVMITTETKSDFKQEMSSFVAVEIYGAVLNDSIVEQKRLINEFGNIVLQVFINVDVIKYETKSDPSFDFKVEGIKEYYENNDLMSFSFLPYADGYLKVFNVNDTESFMVYPFFNLEYPFLNDEKNRKFLAGEKLEFPLNKLMGDPAKKIVGYSISTQIEREKNFLIFVYTKDNIPFKGTPSYKSVLNWIYRITPDKRRIQFCDFVIVNKEAKN